MQKTQIILDESDNIFKQLKLFQKYILMTLIIFSPTAVGRNIHDKLREAALRRADREKKLMERLKRQTRKKLDH